MYICLKQTQNDFKVRRCGAPRGTPAFSGDGLGPGPGLVHQSCTHVLRGNATNERQDARRHTPLWSFYVGKWMVPLPSMRDFVPPLATSQEWNCVHEVRMDNPWRSTNTRFTCSRLTEATAGHGQALLYNWLCVLRQSLSSLSANFSPVLCPPPSEPSVSPFFCQRI